MSCFAGNWISWLQEGLDELDGESLAKLLAPCGRRCARDVLPMYKAVLERAGGDMDRFFESLYLCDGLDGRVVVPGSLYEICFLECLCDLNTQGLVSTPSLCECSRQSVRFVMEQLFACEVQVENRGTILSGEHVCRFLVRAGQKNRGTADGGPAK